MPLYTASQSSETATTMTQALQAGLGSIQELTGIIRDSQPRRAERPVSGMCIDPCHWRRCGADSNAQINSSTSWTWVRGPTFVYMEQPHGQHKSAAQDKIKDSPNVSCRTITARLPVENDSTTTLSLTDGSRLVRVPPILHEVCA